jgi:hypothetical protein
MTVPEGSFSGGSSYLPTMTQLPLKLWYNCRDFVIAHSALEASDTIDAYYRAKQPPLRYEWLELSDHDLVSFRKAGQLVTMAASHWVSDYGLGYLGTFAHDLAR